MWNQLKALALAVLAPLTFMSLKSPKTTMVHQYDLEALLLLPSTANSNIIDGSGGGCGGGGVGGGGGRENKSEKMGDDEASRLVKLS